jgi:RNA methyltransferase, TrmH family
MTLDEIKKLQQKKYREAFGAFWAEGEHLVLELHKALAKGHFAGSRLFVTPEYADFASPLPKTLISQQQMAKISDTQSPQGIGAWVPMPASLPTQRQRLLYLWEIQDPGNLGTLLRSLAWFGGWSCALSPGSVDPYNPKVVRASMGAIFHIPILRDLPLSALAAQVVRPGLLDLQGAPISHPDLGQCDCLILGNEARGLPAEAFNLPHLQRFTIPGAAEVESLNLATAASLALYECHRQGQ